MYLKWCVRPEQSASNFRVISLNHWTWVLVSGNSFTDSLLSLYIIENQKTSVILLQLLFLLHLQKISKLLYCWMSRELIICSGDSHSCCLRPPPNFFCPGPPPHPWLFLIGDAADDSTSCVRHVTAVSPTRQPSGQASYWDHAMWLRDAPPDDPHDAPPDDPRDVPLLIELYRLPTQQMISICVWTLEKLKVMEP